MRAPCGLSLRETCSRSGRASARRLASSATAISVHGRAWNQTRVSIVSWSRASASDPLASPGRALLGTVASLPSEDRFDTILYVDVLEHIEDDRGELTGSAARLRPGGHVVVLAPAHQGLYSPFDKAVGHCRRYSKRSLLAAAPATLQPVAAYYLDAVGMVASLANRLLLRAFMPTYDQLMFWDRVLVPASRVIDPMLAHAWERASWRSGPDPNHRRAYFSAGVMRDRPGMPEGFSRSMIRKNRRRHVEVPNADPRGRPRDVRAGRHEDAAGTVLPLPERSDLAGLQAMIRNHQDIRRRRKLRDHASKVAVQVVPGSSMTGPRTRTSSEAGAVSPKASGNRYCQKAWETESLPPR